jgi:2-iminobutanoate/2-iminopropanoate deaminase
VTRSVIRTDKAPAPFQGAPYSQAIAHGGLVFVSGQLGIDPEGNMVEGGIAEQTEQVMQNLAAVLEESGTGLDRVVMTSIFLVALEDFQPMNEVYASHMSEPYPARATVEIAALPSGARVEIAMIAVR